MLMLLVNQWVQETLKLESGRQCSLDWRKKLLRDLLNVHRHGRELNIVQVLVNNDLFTSKGFVTTRVEF